MPFQAAEIDARHWFRFRGYSLLSNKFCVFFEKKKCIVTERILRAVKLISMPFLLVEKHLLIHEAVTQPAPNAPKLQGWQRDLRWQVKLVYNCKPFRVELFCPCSQKNKKSSTVYHSALLHKVGTIATWLVHDRLYLTYGNYPDKVPIRCGKAFKVPISEIRPNLIILNVTIILALALILNHLHNNRVWRVGTPSVGPLSCRRALRLPSHGRARGA